MTATVKESRAVASASAENLKYPCEVVETRSALIDITMSENKRVVAVKKNFRTQ